MKTRRSLAVYLTVVTLFLFSGLSLFAKTVYVIEFNDYHGMLYPNVIDDRTVPGAVFFANAVFKEIAKDDTNNNVVVVSGGDNYQGTIVSYDTKGLPVNQLFKLIGVKYSAIGNHEFDWGQGNFVKWQEEGAFTFLGANMLNSETGEVADWCKPYGMVDIDGVKIAFIGLSTLDTVITTSAKNLTGLKIEDPWVSAQKWIDFLKQGKAPEGTPDVIIALTHIPSEQNQDGVIDGEEIHTLIKKTTGLNAVLSGHSHKRVCGTIDSIPVVQAQCYGEMYGVLKITINDENGKLQSIEPLVYEVPSKGEILPQNTMSKILEKYSDIEKKYSRVIGTTPGVPYDPQTLSPLGVFMSKLMAEATDSQVGIVNPYGIRGGLDKGNITVGDMFRISPFNNTLVTMKLTGTKLKSVMEYGLSGKAGCVQYYGLDIVYNPTAEAGAKIESMTLLNGDKVEDDKVYTLCTNDFMSTGGDGFNFDGAADVKTHNDLFVRDLMINKIEKLKVLDLPPAKALKIVSADEAKEAA